MMGSGRTVTHDFASNVPTVAKSMVWASGNITSLAAPCAWNSTRLFTSVDRLLSVCSSGWSPTLTTLPIIAIICALPSIAPIEATIGLSAMNDSVNDCDRSALSYRVSARAPPPMMPKPRAKSVVGVAVQPVGAAGSSAASIALCCVPRPCIASMMLSPVLARLPAS